MQVLATLFVLFSTVVHAGPLYKCKGENGRIFHQGRPCEAEMTEVQESKPDFNNTKFRDEMIRTLARMTGKSEGELKDPKIRQAAEILAATDAAKSYAFTKIYGISAKFCDGSVKSDLKNYEEKASDIIALGRYYYSNGIQIHINGRNLSKTGGELTSGLNGMLGRIEDEHKSASPAELKKKCQEASKALKALAVLYSS